VLLPVLGNVAEARQDDTVRRQDEGQSREICTTAVRRGNPEFRNLDTLLHALDFRLALASAR
jgi:DNA-binding phage protein